jgi:hypothetical protein
VIDFTHGNATYYRRHYVEILGNAAFVQYVDNLLSSDLRLKKMAESGLTETEPTFLSNYISETSPNITKLQRISAIGIKRMVLFFTVKNVMRR